jgi:predicted amidohydrolase
VGSASLCGKNEETGMDLFGHSMVVDPWGEVVMDGGEREEGIFCIQCEREKIRAVRETLPALRNMKKSFRR